MSIPDNKRGRKPTTKKSFSLNDFKKKHNFNEIPDKPLEWYVCSPALQAATGIPGFPKGYVGLTRGFSNTGKSTSACEGAVAAQKAGDLPIIIDTENNIGKKRLELMGFDFEKPHILIDNELLLHEYGKKQDKDRNEAAIEDLGKCVHHFLDLQEAGELPMNICFVLDSIGSTDCIRTINALEKNSSDNNQWNAGAYEKSFKYIINSRIPSSRKVNKEFTNTFIGVQKIWIDNMNGGGVKHKGGEAFFYGGRLIFHHGGVAGHATQKVSAVCKGEKIIFGIETKARIEKNQIDSDLGGISIEGGKIISTPHGFIASNKEAIDQYKKDNIQYFRNVLRRQDITADDIGNISFEEINDNERMEDIFSSEED
jgi:hypothetical protein